MVIKLSNGRFARS